MKIYLKELRETQVGLKLTIRLNVTNSPLNVERLLQECGELVSIFVKSIETANRNMTTANQIQL